MAPLVLDGNTLGEKHRSYNKLLNEGSVPPKTDDDDDILVLLNIDVAAKKRDVNYILEVLKSEDELHVSKAIKRSTWLITDKQYAHIINPEHLYSLLRPQMTSRAFNKLMLNIRLHLRDEHRVEEFYNFTYKDNKKTAFKWLQHCSVQFVENEVVKHIYEIPKQLLVRLFKKSFTIFQKYTLKYYEGYPASINRKAEFLARQYPDEFLDFLKSFKEGFYIKFSRKWSKAVSKQCLQKILEDFELFGKHLHIATFAKYLSKNINIEEFLLKHLNNEKLQWMYTHDKIQHFVHNMPQDTRFDFAKKVFIDKEILQDEKEHKNERDKLIQQCAVKCNSLNTLYENTNSFQWYKYAPFETAFTDLKKLIRAETKPTTRVAMLQVLVASAGRNIQHMNTLLQYYHDKHINEPFKFKVQFVNYFMSRVDPQSLDDNSWKLLNQLFHSMEVYIPSDNNVQFCINFILIRNILHKENIPEIITQKFHFNTLKNMEKKLKTQDDKDAVFNFLYKEIIVNFNKLNTTVKEQFYEALALFQQLLNLMKDWNKELNNYPDEIDKIKKLIDVNKSQNWYHDLSPLYTTKKSWKKFLFEESLDLLTSERVCINALKHDPDLLSRHKDQVALMCSNDAVSLRLLLKKIRLYWSCSLAEDWKITYLKRIEQPDGHKALIGGLCTLMSTKELNGLLKKYIPTEAKINWNDTDQHTLSLRKQIAKNAHIARPLPSIEEILPYAKGDYLQFVVPSVSSVLNLMSANKCRQIIPILLDAPVSLQKFGIRCAFNKLDSKELKPMLNHIWNTTKNPSIKSILFIETYRLLCQRKDMDHANLVWDILSTFIDQLSSSENKIIYKKLGNVSKVPDCIKAKFFMKSYTFLSSLPAKCNVVDILQRMLKETTGLMDSLDDDFVVNMFLKDVVKNITEEQNNLHLFSAFILSSKDEEMQLNRYKKSLAPTLKELLPLWGKEYDNEFRIKKHVKNILEKFNNMNIYTFDKQKQIPAKTFQMIQLELENTLSYKNEYVFLTTWKLVTLFVNILSENNHVITKSERKSINEISYEEMEKMYNETHKHIAPSFAKQCIEYLKYDLKQFGSSVYLLFNKALEDFFSSYLCGVMSNGEHKLLYAKCFLESCELKEVWLMVPLFLQNKRHEFYNKNVVSKFKELQEIVNSHTSDEIKMHFHELFLIITPVLLSLC